MNCNCDEWKENAPIIDTALALAGSHGFKTLKKSFSYCPYCNKNIRKPKRIGKKK